MSDLPDHPDGAPRPMQVDPADVHSSAPQVAAPSEAPLAERWAFETRTVKRLMIAGIMFLIAKYYAELNPFVDQTLVTDAVDLIFNVAPLLFLGAAGRARQLAATTGPEKLYWIPRSKQARGLA